MNQINSFKLTSRQKQAQGILTSDATHLLLAGGSRSGKTFLLVRNIVARAIRAPGSRHVIFRFRFNACKQSIGMETVPAVMEKCFPGCDYTINKTDWYVQLANKSEIWIAGLDDKERTEKVLGKEFITIYLNEASQIPYSSRNYAFTRLAQQVVDDDGNILKRRMYYDCNPPTKAHWLYKLFYKKIEPDDNKALTNPDDYQAFRINPVDNVENLANGYLDGLQSQSARYRKRFLEGEFAEDNPNALFNDTDIDKWRAETHPDLVRVIVAVDPSGSGDEDNADNDAIGIVVVGLGVDGNGYVLEDCTVKASPGVWGKVAASAYERHQASVVVGEANFGGDMVRFTIKTANPNIPYKAVTASRGKVQRAEPVSALYDQGKVRHVGQFRDLEEELYSFSTNGFMGERSPNRADALIWAVTELFYGIVKEKKEPQQYDVPTVMGWM